MPTAASSVPSSSSSSDTLASGGGPSAHTAWGPPLPQRSRSITEVLDELAAKRQASGEGRAAKERWAAAEQAAEEAAEAAADALAQPPGRHPPWTAASAAAVWDGARGDGGPGDVWRVRGWGGGAASTANTTSTASTGSTASAGAPSGCACRAPMAAPHPSTHAPQQQQREGAVAVAVRVGDVLGRGPGMAATTAAAAAAAAAAGVAPAAAAACAKCGMILGPWNVHTCGACHAVLYCGAECQEVC